VHPEASWAGLICRTHHYYQWLPNNKWSNFRRWASARNRWLFRENIKKRKV